MNDNPLVIQGKKYQGMDDVAGAVKDQPTEVADAPKEETTAPTIDSIFDEVVNKPEAKKKKQLTVYIDEDVYKEFSKFARPLGKGAKSETINRFLKAKFKM